MNVDQHLQRARDILEPFTGDALAPEANRLDFPLHPDQLIAVVAALGDASWGYLAAITGLDLGPEAGQIEVLYHFCEGAAVITLRVPVPRGEPRVPSLCPVIPSASVFERELAEMFGVRVDGLPDTSRLFLADDWPEGVYPLRKDAILNGTPEGQQHE